MLDISTGAGSGATKIERHSCQLRKSTDENVSCRFGEVAKVIWPRDTAAHIAAIGGKDARTGARWLAGECAPPGIVIAAIVVEITRR